MSESRIESMNESTPEPRIICDPRAFVFSRSRMDEFTERVEHYRGYSGVLAVPVPVITPLKRTYMLRCPRAVVWLYDAACEYYESGLTEEYRRRVQIAAAHETEVERMARKGAFDTDGSDAQSDAA